MYVYDQTIKSCLELFEKYPKTKLPVTGKTAKEVGNQNFILRSEMAYELGGSGMAAVSGTIATGSEWLEATDEICLIGPDLDQIGQDVPYARITFLRMKKEKQQEEKEIYSMMRKAEYRRFHVNPKGYMIRISPIQNREAVRVEKKAIQNGLDFGAVGRLFLKEYHRNPDILAVKMFFVTLEEFPFQQLEQDMRQAEEITNSLEHILQGFVMDCRTCSSKAICDEVEGLKEMHQLKQKEAGREAD